jgi:hypothetical protein
MSRRITYFDESRGLSWGSGMPVKSFYLEFKTERLRVPLSRLSPRLLRASKRSISRCCIRRGVSSDPQPYLVLGVERQRVVIAECLEY